MLHVAVRIYCCCYCCCLCK